MPSNPVELDGGTIKGTDVIFRDSSAIHTINEIGPNANGELATVLGLSIVNGKLCVTYQEEVDA